jgi:hypothetical protein
VRTRQFVVRAVTDKPGVALIDAQSASGFQKDCGIGLREADVE